MDKRLAKVSAEQRLMEWAELVRECRNSELTCREWCAQHGIPERRYHYWQKRVFDRAVLAREEVISLNWSEEGKTQFVELPGSVEGECYVQRGGKVVASIRIGEGTIDVYAGTEPEVIKMLCRVLRSC